MSALGRILAKGAEYARHGEPSLVGYARYCDLEAPEQILGDVDGFGYYSAIRWDTRDERTAWGRTARYGVILYLCSDGSAGAMAFDDAESMTREWERLEAALEVWNETASTEEESG